MNHYFGVIGDNDTEFMERCYVSERDYHHAFDGMRSLIQDSLSPYFREYGVQQLEDTGKGGGLGGRLTKNIKKGRKGEVLVLFGGKGAGKSTFIKRLLHHNPPRWLRDHAVVAIADLLKMPEETEVIRKTIWDHVVGSLDSEGILDSDRSSVLEKLFSDRFEVANRQELAGLPRASEIYNTRLNELVTQWKDDKIYCAKRLVEFWKSREKGIIVVVDNTDQYSGPNQDFCFASAQQISDELACVTLISMREERFYNSKIHGVLDDLFRSFLLSGYTNVEEMLTAGAWNFQIHQVIKPVMIPTRYFYDELLSDIPNIYQLRYNRHGSHFTALRILRKLARNIEGASTAYLSMAELKNYFSETFNMLEDFTKNSDMLLSESCG